MNTIHPEVSDGLQSRMDSSDFRRDVPVSLVISDPLLEDNPIIYVSESFERLTGYDRSAVIGRNCRFLQGEESDPETVRALRDAIEAEETFETAIYNYRSDGSGFWNRLMIDPLRDENGDVRYFVGVQQLIESLEKAPETSIDDMLAEIQHRVKNHLSMVVGMIRIQAQEADARDTFDNLARRVEALQLLYSEMSESGAASSADKSVPLGAYLSRIASAISHIDGRNAVRVNVSTDAVEVPVETAARTGLIFSEILTNSLQHAFKGRDEGVVEAQARMLSGDTLRITVMDDGIGMPDGCNWPREGNLGAKIVRNLIDGLEGDLSVDTLKKGTTISVDIPLASQEAIIAAEDEPAEEPTLDGSNLE